MVANFWLQQGPITKSEKKEIFKYLNRHHLPRTKENINHQAARLRKRNEIRRYLKGKEDSTTDVNPPWEICYGQSVLGGTITFIHLSGPNEQPNLYLSMVITIAAHEIYRVRKVYFDGYEVTWDTDLLTRPTGVLNATGIFQNFLQAQINYGSDSQAALSYPVGNSDAQNPVSAKWTSNHRQRGHAHMYFKFKFNETVFKNGVPDIQFFIDGKYDIVDPRGPTAAPGAGNVAMAFQDYLKNSRFGPGFSAGDIHTSRLNQAITDCEDIITLASGVENRYLLNTHFSTDDDPGDIIQNFLGAMAGRMTYTEGKFNIYAGKAKSVVVDLGPGDILDDIIVTTKTPRMDSFNTVRTTFVSTQNNWEESEGPVVSNSTYVTQDNGETVYEDLTFAYTASNTMIQRLAKIELERVRQGIVVESLFTMKAYQAEVGEWITLTLPRFGWSAKKFEIVRQALTIEQTAEGTAMFAVRMTLREIANEVFDWNNGEEMTHDPAPDTNLPNPFTIADPTSFTVDSGTARLYIKNDGTVWSRAYLEWVAPADAYVVNGGYIEVQFKRHADSTWQDATDVPGSSTNYYVLDVEDGISYDFQIRSVNGLGVRGNWVQVLNHVVLGKSAPPSDVTGLTATQQDYGFRLNWTPVSDVDLREYEIRVGNGSSNWATATLVANIRTAAYYYETRTAGTYKFFVKAIDTSGNYSVNAASVTSVVAAPSAPTVTYAIDGQDVVLEWNEPSSTFAIKEYEIRYGASYSAGTPVATVTALRYRFKANWGGARNFFVIARDVAGNDGADGTVTATITSPGAVANLRGWQVDNNPLIDWDVPVAGSLPVLKYNVYKSRSNIGDYDLIGTVDGTFFTYVEQYSAIYTYRIRAVDSAGNEGTANTVDIPVSNPRDFFFHVDDDLGPLDNMVLVNCVDNQMPGFERALGIYVGANTTETWSQHFTNNSNSTIQDFIDDGYSYWFQPGVAGSGAASSEWSKDLGAVVGEATIIFSMSAVNAYLIDIVPTITIGYKTNIGDSWTNVVGQPGRLDHSVIGTNFRYVRFLVEYDVPTSTSNAFFYDFLIQVRTKKQTVEGQFAVSAGDAGAGGTLQAFGNQSFLDVLDIQVTAEGTGASDVAFVVLNFNDIPNPTFFRVILYNAAGTALSRNARYKVTGLVGTLD